MTIIQSNYKAWQAFKFKGKKFLALIARSGDIYIYGERMGNYGSWFSVENFKKYYAKDGELLMLDCSSVNTETI